MSSIRFQPGNGGATRRRHIARLRQLAVGVADRLIQACGGLSQREMREQVLDSMELERERGITIKAQTVRLT